MSELQDLVTSLDEELDAEFEDRLRQALSGKSQDWLVDALVQQIHRDRHLEAAPQRQLARQAEHVEPLADRKRRVDRIRALGLDEVKLRETLARYESLHREALVSEGYLLDPPHKGKEALTSQHRSAEGETLLREAHDLFYALLYCDERQGVRLTRARRDFLTVTLPSAKANSLERFMLAVTESRVAGTWLDPEGVSDDIGAINKILQVEFGDSADELVSKALIAVLRLINNLEVNEEILYARIERLERSTLV